MRKDCWPERYLTGAIVRIITRGSSILQNIPIMSQNIAWRPIEPWKMHLNVLGSRHNVIL